VDPGLATKKCLQSQLATKGAGMTETAVSIVGLAFPVRSSVLHYNATHLTPMIFLKQVTVVAVLVTETETVTVTATGALAAGTALDALPQYLLNARDGRSHRISAQCHPKAL